MAHTCISLLSRQPDSLKTKFHNWLMISLSKETFLVLSFLIIFVVLCANNDKCTGLYPLKLIILDVKEIILDNT